MKIFRVERSDDSHHCLKMYLLLGLVAGGIIQSVNGVPVSAANSAHDLYADFKEGVIVVRAEMGIDFLNNEISPELVQGFYMPCSFDVPSGFR